MKVTSYPGIVFEVNELGGGLGVSPTPYPTKDNYPRYAIYLQPMRASLSAMPCVWYSLNELRGLRDSIDREIKRHEEPQ
jgi:hypothetical protein